ncbi:MAG: V-type ATP synthase subunit E [Massiliimalia sp.]|jgi:V/A-type H+-transporting ATPase subunit E
MTGLEQILHEIQKDAELGASETMKQAQKDCEQLLAEADEEAKRRKAEILEQGEQEKNQKIARAKSANRLMVRKRVLDEKGILIQRLIDQAEEDLANLREDVYFPLLIRLAEKNALAGEGEMHLSPKDFKRLPEDFEKQLNRALSAGKKIQISRETRPCKGGFILSYGGIEVNCSLEALFASRKEQLQDLANEALFQEEDS